MATLPGYERIDSRYVKLGDRMVGRADIYPWIEYAGEVVDTRRFYQYDGPNRGETYCVVYLYDGGWIHQIKE
jgi:hypothetical protein